MTLLVVLNVPPASAGVVKEGDVPNTSAPVPVSSVTADAKFADEGVARNVATPVPKPEIPVETGRPVQLVRVPDCGVPKIGVTKVGLVANTLAPVPVSSVSREAKFADEGVAKKVAAPLPNPETPVEIGRPVQLVRVPDCGVPKMGVTKVGVLANTSAPVPVSSVTAEAKLADDGVARNAATPVPKPVTAEIPICDHEVSPLVLLVMKYPLAPAGTAAGSVKL